MITVFGMVSYNLVSSYKIFRGTYNPLLTVD